MKKVWICCVGFDYEGFSIAKVCGSQKSADKWEEETERRLKLPFTDDNRIPGDYCCVYEKEVSDD